MVKSGFMWFKMVLCGQRWLHVGTIALFNRMLLFWCPFPSATLPSSPRINNPCIVWYVYIGTLMVDKQKTDRQTDR